MNFCGSDIGSWEETVRGNLSGSHVRQRPGYAQIGYVETQLVAQNAYVNNIGILDTPALAVTGNLQVSFKAMAYKNTSVYAAGNNTAKDFDGDARTAVSYTHLDVYKRQRVSLVQDIFGRIEFNFLNKNSMKNRTISILLGLLAFVTGGCEDMLDRFPKDKLTPENYFHTEEECRLYTNDFYSMFPNGSAIYGETADVISQTTLTSEVLGTRVVRCV